MNTVKLFKITCTKAFQMSEQGEGFALTPWGNDTADYQGHDDGGKDYELPAGYEIAESKSGINEIYDEQGQHCSLVPHSCGRPSLVSTTRTVVLKEVVPTDEAAERRDARIAAMKAVTEAPDFETEQKAIKSTFVVDLRPSLPQGAVDLYHGWNEKDDPITTMDYVEVMKKIGAGFDRGARRYVIRQADVKKARGALIEAGFLPCISPALLIGE